jgi:hypothetical protein
MKKSQKEEVEEEERAGLVLLRKERDEEVESSEVCRSRKEAVSRITFSGGHARYPLLAARYFRELCRGR